ncbi:MAG TPA: hypothetical protein VEV44_05470 [Pseudoneobacillus sp.]|nr:hypothetical protein [Pseudoneobacillus sp.]
MLYTISPSTAISGAGKNVALNTIMIVAMKKIIAGTHFTHLDLNL